jgi:hypothetical protein
MVMKDPKDSDDQRDIMLKAWHEYGKNFSAFPPEEQPFPDIWEPEIPGPDEKGRLHLDALKHWEYLFPNKDFLHQRYAKYHVLEGPSLWFDCLVPKRQRRIRHRKGEDQEGQPVFLDVKDSHEWYDSSLRIGIFKWQVGFSCRSVLCQRKWCKLHRDNPHRINPADIYSLVDLFEGCGFGQAISIVSKWFGVKIQPFDSKGTEQVQGYRYSVSKEAVYELLSRYADMRHQHVESFVKEAVELIKGSEVVPWHRRKFGTDCAFFSLKVVGNLYRIKSPAAKAYLWLLIQQEEAARNTKTAFKVTDGQVAEDLSVTRMTAGNYREQLLELRLVEVEETKIGRKREIWVRKVKY